MYDVRELAGVEDDTGSMVGSLEREKGVLVDDLRWQGHLSHHLTACTCSCSVHYMCEGKILLHENWHIMYRLCMCVSLRAAVRNNSYLR